MIHNNSVFIGKTQSGQDFFIGQDQKLTHILCLGASGTGKTVNMLNMALQDANSGLGVCFIDPFGDAADTFMTKLPKEKLQNLIVFMPTLQSKSAFGLNILDSVGLADYQVLDIVFNIFAQNFNLREVGGPRFESYFRYYLQTMIIYNTQKDKPKALSLMDLPNFLTDQNFKEQIVKKCFDSNLLNQDLKDFWSPILTNPKTTNQLSAQDLDQNLSQTAYQQSSNLKEKPDGQVRVNIFCDDIDVEPTVGYLIAKMSPFLKNGQVSPSIDGSSPNLNFSEILNQNKTFVVSLQIGVLGELAVKVLGQLVLACLSTVSTIRDKAYIQKDLQDQNSKTTNGNAFDANTINTGAISVSSENKSTHGRSLEYFVYVDEFQYLANDVTIYNLRLATKNRIGFCFSLMHSRQLDDRQSEKLFSECATKFVYNCTKYDFEYLCDKGSTFYNLQDRLKNEFPNGLPRFGFLVLSSRGNLEYQVKAHNPQISENQSANQNNYQLALIQGNYPQFFTES